MFSQYTEDKEQAVPLIRDDRVKQDGVCSPAGTDDAKHLELFQQDMSVHEIDKGPFIIRENAASSVCLAIWTSFQFGSERGHILVKESRS